MGWQLPLLLVGGFVTLMMNVPKSPNLTRQVQTTYGTLIGEDVWSDEAIFLAFRGIHYAKAPRGALRFKGPEPPLQWNGVKYATKYGSICPQGTEPPSSPSVKIGEKVRRFIKYAPNYARIAMQLLKQSEDCLTLNVYTTQLGEFGLRPVLVWFHGGGFYSGEGTDALYGPEYLVKEDIVVVTANYRLGPLGFLSTNTSDASGNWGLKDQVAALKWVKENIANFGGDPEQVTIYGESAGSASVHYHLLSPLSKGLFHKAIMSSGVATSDWALNVQQDRLSRNLARLTGAFKDEATNPTSRVKHLRALDTKTLMKFMWYSMEETPPWVQDKSTNSGFIPYVPVVEPPGTPGAFLTEDPKEIMKAGTYSRVPVMMGFNDLDGGVLFTGPNKYSSPEQLEQDEINVCEFLPRDLKDAVEERKACAEVSNRISEVYFDGMPANSSALEFVHFFGDRAIAHSVRAAQKWFARYSGEDNPAYFYYFTYDGEWNLVKDVYSIKLPGVTHWDELVYVFKQKIKDHPRLEKTSPGLATHKRMLSFITNFMKYGTPTPFESVMYPPWEPANADELNTMVIGEDVKMEKDILKKRMDLWNNLYKEYIGDSYYD